MNTRWRHRFPAGTGVCPAGTRRRLSFRGMMGAVDTRRHHRLPAETGGVTPVGRDSVAPPSAHKAHPPSHPEIGGVA